MRARGNESVLEKLLFKRPTNQHFYNEIWCFFHPTHLPREKFLAFDALVEMSGMSPNKFLKKDTDLVK